MKTSEKKILFYRTKQIGVIGEWNPGPLAPKARIIPLDQSPTNYYVDL